MEDEAPYLLEDDLIHVLLGDGRLRFPFDPEEVLLERNGSEGRVEEEETWSEGKRKEEGSSVQPFDLR